MSSSSKLAPRIIAPDLRFAVKDCIDIVGSPTGMGSKAYREASAATSDAAVVKAFKNAGCAFVGKVTMHELAFGVTGVNRYCGTPLKPNYPQYIVGGSIRMPAACCGLFGLKTSFGRVDHAGVYPSGSSLDCLGLISNNFAHLEQGASVMINGYRRQESVHPLTLGVLQVHVGAAHRAGLTLISYEAAKAYAQLDEQLLGRDIAHRLRAAKQVTREQYQSAQHYQANFKEQVNRLLQRFDALLLPTLPSYPQKLDEALEGKMNISTTSLVRPFNVSGHPALTIPLENNRGPAALQLVGKHNGEDSLLALARRLLPHINIAQFSKPDSVEE
ncbi:MAG: amidase [Cellvibrionaceae bacterium]|nr:amidase [Cellvibrionaceae bacterium]